MRVGVCGSCWDRPHCLDLLSQTVCPFLLGKSEDLGGEDVKQRKQKSSSQPVGAEMDNATKQRGPSWVCVRAPLM